METHITLKELSSYIKDAIQLSFPESIWIIAEIGELKVNYSGHCYIDLIEKDPNSDEIIARSKATIWSWQFRFIKPYFETTTGQALSAGIKVLLSASVEFHEVYGFSLNIKDIDPSYTLGDMARKRKEIIARLNDEGVMEMNKELELPEIPSRIAIISSGTAAGYEDFMNQLHHNDRGYVFYTKLFQAVMQGNEAQRSIIAALDQIYEHEDQFDLVVIIRGGGAQMDLSCFDSYDIAYYITQFPLPILTGIGHDKDESVADMVAHTKLKTPTAVANFLIDRFDEAANTIEELEANLNERIFEIINNAKQQLNQAVKLFKPLIKSKLQRTNIQLEHTMNSVNPTVIDFLNFHQNILFRLSNTTKTTTLTKLKFNENKLEQQRANLTFAIKLKTEREKLNITEKQHITQRLSLQTISNEHHKIDWLEKNTQLIDPKNILKRGFSITLKNGKALKNISEVEPGDVLINMLYDGEIESTVNNKSK